MSDQDFTSDIPTKLCSRNGNCQHPNGPLLPATPKYFHRDANRSDGLRVECKACFITSRGRKWVESVEVPDGYSRCYRGDKCLSVGGPILPATSEYFYFDKYRNGVASRCKLCGASLNEKWRTENPDKAKAGIKRWRKKNPEKVRVARRRKEKTVSGRARRKRYAQRKAYKKQIIRAEEKAKKFGYIPEDFKLCSRKENCLHIDGPVLPISEFYGHENARSSHCRICDKEYGRLWRSKYPSKARIVENRRRSRKRNLPSTFTVLDWKRSLEYFNGACAYCQRGPSMFDANFVLHQEHHIPLVKGGGYTPDNIVPACQSCNLSKRDSDFDTWSVSRFGKRKAKEIAERIAEYFKLVSQP